MHQIIFLSIFAGRCSVYTYIKYKLSILVTQCMKKTHSEYTNIINLTDIYVVCCKIESSKFQIPNYALFLKNYY